MDAVILLRAAYIGAALAVILVAVIPPLRDRFLAYGARATPSSNGEKAPRAKEGTDGENARSSMVTQTLDIIAAWKVPHSSFWTFYCVATGLAAFWAAEILVARGPVYQTIIRWTASQLSSMSFDQVTVTWLLFFTHTARRLKECLSDPSSASLEGKKTASKMWIGHWLLGIGFYILTSVAIWIEGAPNLSRLEPSLGDIRFRAPSLRTIIAVVAFILASGLQTDCHAYLTDLKASKSSTGKPDENGYRMPEHPAFTSLIAPHYTAECVIYVALALVAAPRGQWINLTLASALVFVVVNLGVTSAGTREWYEKKFGADAVKQKWNMIPGIY